MSKKLMLDSKEELYLVGKRKAVKVMSTSKKKVPVESLKDLKFVKELNITCLSLSNKIDKELKELIETLGNDL